MQAAYKFIQIAGIRACLPKAENAMAEGQRGSFEKKMPSGFEKNIRKWNRFILCGLLFQRPFSFGKMAKQKNS